MFIVAGNHEYYQTTNIKPLTINDTDKLIETICSKFNNVHFLNNSHYELNNEYVILGTTLWSHIPESSYRNAKNTMNDFRQIYYFDDKTKFVENIKPQHVSSLYEKNKEWLENKLKEYENKKIIVVTHHLPSFKMINKQYINDPVTCCFASHLDHLINSNKNIKYWLCGHTHDNIDINLNLCRCVVNPFGYKGENNKFIYDLVLNLE